MFLHLPMQIKPQWKSVGPVFCCRHTYSKETVYNGQLVPKWQEAIMIEFPDQFLMKLCLGHLLTSILLICECVFQYYSSICSCSSVFFSDFKWDRLMFWCKHANTRKHVSEHSWSSGWVILSIFAHVAHLAQSYFSLIFTSINTSTVCFFWNDTKENTIILQWNKIWKIRK